MNKRDPRHDLVLAYREAGLHEKADALVAEMLKEQGITPTAKIKDFDEIKSKLDASLAELRSKIGVPPKRRR